MTNVGKNTREGFTLIEIMIAITILAIMSVVVVPGFLSYLETARISSAKENLRVFDNAITQYQLAVGQLPSRLKDLVKAPSDEKAKKKWPGSFLKKSEIPEDPWHEPFQYKTNPPGSKNQYELYSFGPKRKGSPKETWIHANSPE